MTKTVGKLPKFADIIGLYADDEIDVSTPLEADLQQFTPEQIEGHLRSLVAIARVYPQIEPALTAAVQIIKQLQCELAADSIVAVGLES